MLFSSTVFIFIFLPVLLLLYFAIPKKYLAAKNGLLLIFSLGFYAWGEPKFVLIMILSIIGNYIFGRLISEQKSKKGWLITGISFNVLIIFIFKYLNFVIANVNALLVAVGAGNIQITQTSIALPIGISFFTFQAISYIIDVYRGKVQAQRNPFYLGLYISFFPQLIAGPIVRYSDINLAITERKESLDKFSIGVKRFVFGLSKKVILSNNFALIADQAFSLSEAGNTTTAMAWLGMVAYTLQIFFDFSGYSDMAIGLGKMFGFDFNENFNYPYISKSVSEFWRRWHISLGSWFRDYVYFPLGGSRVDTNKKLVRNLFVVWLLTGVWHGASWNFIIWGLMYFVLITFEKLTGYPNKFSKPVSANLYMVFTLLCVMLGWVIFRAEGIENAVDYLLSLIGVGTTGAYDNEFVRYLCENKAFLLFGIILSTPLIKNICTKSKMEGTIPGEIVKTIVCIVLLIVCVSYLVLESYNPFIYFNF